MFRKVRLVTILLALALLISGAAHAMPRQEGPLRGGALTRVWDWIAALFRIGGPHSGGETKSIWQGEGSHADPNGNP